jgi:hypothetical protein
MEETHLTYFNTSAWYFLVRIFLLGTKPRNIIIIAYHFIIEDTLFGYVWVYKSASKWVRASI